MAAAFTIRSSVGCNDNAIAIDTLILVLPVKSLMGAGANCSGASLQ